MAVTVATLEETLRRVEALEELSLDAELLAAFAQRPACGEPVNFYTPTFKHFESAEIAACGRNAWPALSITGSDCKLKCDHCKAAILEPMIPARTPEALWRRVNELIAGGAEGMLLTGGSNHANEVEYGPFYSTLRRIKREFPDFRIALHTALVDEVAADAMAESGVDVAMMDLIGAQETITQVYHLKRSVEDFERTLEILVARPMKVVPHIVLGLHYGRLLGEARALEMLVRHTPDAVVLVVVMPFYAPPKRPFAIPEPRDVGHLFLEARRRLPQTPLLLGCARPPGEARRQIDTYAVLAGLNGIAHPSEGIVELAARLERPVRVSPACCSIAVGDEVFAGDGREGLQLDLDQVLAHERARRGAGALGGIPVVEAGG